MERSTPPGDGPEAPAEPSIPLVHADLEQATLGDRAFEKELLGEFLDGAPRMLASLDGALATKNLPALHHAAHNLKGCSRTIGARPLGRACELLEREARVGTLDEADALLDRIRAHLAEVETFVRRRWAL